MANILGLAAIAGNAAQDQIIARRKDKALQEEEDAARSAREEFASRRGLRDNAAAFEGEKVTQGRKDLGKASADKQAVQDAIKKAAADFTAQNPYQSPVTPDAQAAAPAPVDAPAPQAAAGLAPSMPVVTPNAAPASASMAASTGLTPLASGPAAPAQQAAPAITAPAAKQADPSHGMKRAAYIAQAAADQHLANGDMTGYKQASDDAIHMRDALRAQEFNISDAEFARTGDATVYAKRIYPLFHDGFSLVDARQSIGPDGKPIITSTRRNDQTGETETRALPVDKFLEGVKELRKPGTLAALEERTAAEKRDVANHIAKGAPALQNALDIAKMNDATHRIAANASAAHSYAAAGLVSAQVDAMNNAKAPVWNDKADAYLEKNYAVKDDVTGAVSIDGDGMQFAKKLAIGQAKSNGGDTVSGLGYAFDVDSRLKAKVAAAVKADPKADPKALLRTERANYLNILTTPKAASSGIAADASNIIDMSKLDPETRAYLQKLDPEAYATSMANFNKPSATAKAQPMAASGMPKTASKTAPQDAARPVSADGLGKTFAERQTALLKKKQDADADQELQKLLQDKEAALKQGKPVAANNALAKYNELKLQRYGI